jgi:NAD+ synthase (glutamine-hydrolysing)
MGAKSLRVAMAQINPTVGDLDGNIGRIRRYIDMAKDRDADLVVFPELSVTGYPPQDLLLETSFVKQNKKMLANLISHNSDMAGVIGFVDYERNKHYNAAAVFTENEIVGVVHKTLLPTYDVFDEDRYFETTIKRHVKPVLLANRIKLGVEICEDLWDEAYDIKVTNLLAKRGSDLIVNISASPFYVGKRFEREQLLKRKARENDIPIFYVNMVGGQDELVFDGQSLAVNRSGGLIAFGKQFEEDLIVVDIDLGKGVSESVKAPDYDEEEEMFGAIVLGIRDYFRKTNFKKAIVGMSGGIDSSLTACIACQALGKENVIGVSMPSKFSSDRSKVDAEELAENLGICFVQIHIQDVVEAYQGALHNALQEIRKRFQQREEFDDPVADENIQPRVRGNCLMDISNRLKDLRILLLNTGNKTELALGYCTLYGDMAGGIGVLGDVSKLDVYRLARYVNKKFGRIVIPETVLSKKPSPELKENQFDPFDFDMISPLVDEIVENRKSRKELVKMGYPQVIVEDTIRRIRNAEYKRWQAAPCIKITRKAFGIGRKMPIVNAYAG